MKRTAPFLAAASVLALGLTPSNAANTMQTRQALSDTLSNTCPPAEDVTISGVAHANASSTSDGAGGTHVTLHHNFQGVSGVGQTSGDRYSLPGQVRQVMNMTNGATSQTAIVTSRAIRQGSADDLVVEIAVHVTTNANGVEHVHVDPLSMTCKG